jgi:hypothetical protein
LAACLQAAAAAAAAAAADGTEAACVSWKDVSSGMVLIVEVVVVGFDSVL